MSFENAATEQSLHHLRTLARQYPTVQAASTEIINLQAILNLPKGTEHFISDIHGEHEAFLHILNSASGVVREKVDLIFEDSLSSHQRKELCTLIYYPRAKLSLRGEREDNPQWFRSTLRQLIDVCRVMARKYTRSKVRKALPADHAYIIDELLHIDRTDKGKLSYMESIIDTIIETGQASAMVTAICYLISHLAVDRLHIVGDIFDRGPRADIILDRLLQHHSVDVQWGNHDILWMGAACGSRTLVATVLANSIHYNNLAVIESGYGISLRPLSVFANEVYDTCDVSRFQVKLSDDIKNQYSEKEQTLSARMHKAITIILFKLEGQKLLRRPEFGMADRLLLDKIDYESKTVTIGTETYPLEDCDFPTVDPKDPYALTAEEDEVINQLTASFQNSEKLQRHIRFLYSQGGLYKVYNGNLLYHGCIPMTEEGQFMSFSVGCDNLCGKAFLDYAEQAARRAYYDKPGSDERIFGMDFLWFLWAGRNSPIFGRSRMTTFERRLILDESSWDEPKNPYYTHYQNPDICTRILQEFGLAGEHCHIINGHVPVKSKRGESPIKGGGKLLVIDGGFCKAYQKTTGIAGYTLISNSRNMRIVAHEPFAGRKRAIEEDWDIASTSTVFEHMEDTVKIAQTDVGKQISERVQDLRALLDAYRAGTVAENHQN